MSYPLKRVAKPIKIISAIVPANNKLEIMIIPQGFGFSPKESPNRNPAAQAVKTKPPIPSI